MHLQLYNIEFSFNLKSLDSVMSYGNHSPAITELLTEPNAIHSHSPNSSELIIIHAE